MAVGCAVLLRLLLLVAVVTAVAVVGGVARTGNGFDPKASNISGVNIDRECIDDEIERMDGTVVGDIVPCERGWEFLAAVAIAAAERSVLLSMV